MYILDTLCPFCNKKNVYLNLEIAISIKPFGLTQIRHSSFEESRVGRAEENRSCNIAYRTTISHIAKNIQHR
jgi:hypothetical protein